MKIEELLVATFCFFLFNMGVLQVCVRGKEAPENEDIVRY